MAENKLSSTNIAEILDAQITAMKKINDIIVGSKIDEAMLNNIVKTVKPLQDVMKALSGAADAMSKIKLNGPFTNIKFKIGLKQFLNNLTIIANAVGTIKVDKNSAKKVKDLAMCAGSLEMIAESLSAIGKLSLGIALMRKMILKTIDLALEINEKIANSKKGKSDPKMIVALANGLTALARGLLLFVVGTMFGLVPILATVAMLAIKLFLKVYFSVFNGRTAKKLQTAEKAMARLALTMTILSTSVMLLALTGLLISQSLKQFSIVILYLVFVTTMFFMIALIVKFMKETKATKSILYIALTLYMLSLTVVMLVLAGQLITEEWKSLLMVSSYLLIIVGSFVMLALASKFIQEGAKQMLWVALSVAILAAVVYLMIGASYLVNENWESILMVMALMAVLVGAMIGIALASKLVQEGATTMIIMAASLIVFAVGMMLIAKAAESFTWEQFGLLAAILGMISLFAIGLGVAAPYPQLGAATIIMIAVSLVILAGGLALMGAVMKGWGIDTVLNMGLLLGIIAVEFAILGLAAIPAMLGAAALSVISLSLILLGVGMAAMQALVLNNTSEDAISLLGDILVTLATKFTLLGLTLPLIILGSIAATILSGAMLVISVALFPLMGVISIAKNLNVKDADVVRPIDLMALIVNAINSRFGGIRGTIRLASAVGKAFMLLPIAAAIGMIAKVLQNIAKLSIPVAFDKDGNPTEVQRMKPEDFVEAATNAANIAFILASIFADEDTMVNIGGKDITIHAISQDTLANITWRTKWKMNQLAQISTAIGTMAGTLQNIASLNVPDPDAGWTEEGKPKGFKQMKAEDFAMAAENASSIAVMLSSIFAEKDTFLFIGGKLVRIKCINTDALDNITRGAKNKMERLSEITTSIGNMANVLQAVASLNMPTEFDKNGKPIAFKQMGAEEFAAASANVILIMTLLLGAVGSEELSTTLEELDADAAENFGIILKGCEGLQYLMDAIQKSVNIDDMQIATGIGNIRTALSAYIKILNDLFIGESEFVWKKGWLGIPYPSINIIKPPEIDLDDLESAKESLMIVVDAINATMPIMDNLKVMSENAENCNPTKISEIIKTYLESVYGDEQGNGGIKIDSQAILKQQNLKFLVDQQERIANLDVSKLQNNTDSFVKFIDKANSIDTNKIKSVRDMFEQMARFSESISGDFDKLADVLNNELIEILEKLNGTLLEIKDKSVQTIQTGNAATQGITTTTSITQTPVTQPQAVQQTQVTQKEKKINTGLEQNIANIKAILERFEQAGWGFEQ